MSFQRRASAFDLARRAGARFVGVSSAGSAELEEYMASGTYTPTVTTDGGATVAPALLSGWSRVGNGAGVPLAGDTVSVYGFFSAAGLTDGEIVTVSLPFELAVTVGPYVATPVMNGTLPTDLSASGGVGSPTTLRFTFTVAASDSDSAISFAITYQTANAVDP